MKVIEFPGKKSDTDDLKEFLMEVIDLVDEFGFTKVAAVLMTDDEEGAVATNASAVETTGMFAHGIKSL